MRGVQTFRLGRKVLATQTRRKAVEGVTMRYAECGAIVLEDGFSEAVTKELVDPLLLDAVANYINGDTGRPEWSRVPRVLITTEDQWSGYSEFTITSRWQGVIITVPDWNLEREFDDIPSFFAALSKYGNHS